MDDLLSRIATLPADKRSLLLKRYKERNAQSKAQTIVRQEGDRGTYPLSFAQQRLWVDQQLDPGSFKYNLPEAVHIQGPLDIVALEKSLNEIVRRHESWRTKFSLVDEEPVQVITPSLIVSIPIVEMSDVPDAEREAKAMFLAIEEGQKPFDLTRLPLFRPLIFKLRNDVYIFVLTSHHIISDRWSIGLIIQELLAGYEAFSRGDTPALADPPFQYKDFSVWQREWLKGEAVQSDLSYWRQQLGGTLPVLDLPTDRPLSAEHTYRGESLKITLPKSVNNALNALQHQENATRFMVLLAAINTLLFRYTGQDDIILGIPIANRNRPEIERVVGFFINMLALRADLSGNPTFRELLERVRKVTLDGYAHQDFPFEKLIQELQPGRDSRRTPLFQVCVNHQNIPISALKMNNLILHRLDLNYGITRFDLTFFLLDTPEAESEEEGLSIVFSYNADLFEAGTIKRMAEHLQVLLQGIINDPDSHISDLPLLTPAQQRQLLLDWNDHSLQVDTSCIQLLFEAQAERSPYAAAVLFGNQHLTYSELNHRANQLAHHLRSLGVGAEAIVGICLNRSIEMIVALLGIIKAGGAYLPLDPNYPKDRLSFMLEDAGVEVLITEQPLTQYLPEHNAMLVLLDTDWQAIAQASRHNPICHNEEGNLVYVIYTSGSTGLPKAVMIEHKSLANLAEAFHQAVYAHRRPGLRISMNAPLSFDASVKQWMQLLYGHTLCIFPEEIRLEAKRLNAYIQEHRVDVLDITPSQMKALLGAGSLSDTLGGLKVAFVAGEAIDESLWAILAGSIEIDFYNLYGPTECTDDTTYVLMSESPAKATIGRQIANVRLYVLDKHLNPVPVGVTGELYIGGAGVGRGYLRRMSETSESFIPDKFSAEPGKRLYKTGDLVRFMADGNIEFVGRVDHQVKVRGHRIELGEIEELIGRKEGVKEVVVMAREDSPGDIRLVAYIVPNQQTDMATAGELHKYLESKIPDYMIPSAFVKLESLPLTPNKKLDLRALPAPEYSRNVLIDAYVAPRNSTEETLTEIWAEVLRVDQVGVHDDFFKLGGHSLLAIQMIVRARKRFGIDLALPRFLNLPTVAGLASILNEKPKGESPFSILAPIRESGTRKPLFCIHAAGGHVMPYQALVASLDSDQPAYGLQSRGLVDPRQEHKSINQMAADYADIIRRQQPEGPYYLVGWSMGGVIAVSIARELERRGQKAAFVGLIDSYLFTDDPYTMDSDPLLGLGLAFGGALATAFQALSSEQRQVLRAELLALSSDKRIQRVIHWGQERDLLPAELSLEIIQHQVILAEIHDKLLRAHEAPVVQAPLHVWWAREQMRTGISHTNWSKYSSATVRTETADGNHFTIIQSSQCRDLAERLQECLKTAGIQNEKVNVVNSIS